MRTIPINAARVPALRALRGLLLTGLVGATLALPAHAGRVIVQFKPGAEAVQRAAVTGGAPTAADAARVTSARAATLSTRTGLALRAGSPVGTRTQVVTSEELDSEALAARLAVDGDVEFAVPDRRVRLNAAPNDPLYGPGLGGNGPAAGQWYLRAPEGEVLAAIDAESAWNVTAGSPGVVVAVLDTGVRYDHPDLATNLLPGFDMIEDTYTANDGSGRDADASDPGDWVSDYDIAEHLDCGASDPSPSSWHGTGVAAVIAALTNNGTGMAGVARNVRVQPVRVLGKCGGYDSDIIAGMRWAAGLSVPGIGTNPTPARVINMSLGGAGACGPAYTNAMSEVIAQGVTVVVAAGNAAGHAIGAPGNCPGAITVAGVRHVGTKVGFSNLGSEVAISAPAGNCVNTDPGSACLYPILTASNTGREGPEEHAYSDAYNVTVGTSFSTPLVSGTVALMLSAQPTLTPAQIRSTLRGSARPFPASTDFGVGTCQAPQYSPMGQPVDQLECSCTTSTCGAGMLDAGAAVRAVSGGAAISTVVEYYHAALDHYFISWLPEEIAALDAGTTIQGWTRTGRTFKTWTAPGVGTSSQCRYYIPPALGNSHFFGRDIVECEQTSMQFPALVFEAQGIMHMQLPSQGICPAGTVPMYRVYSNRADANHRYLTDKALRDQMVAKGWVAEGEGPDIVVMCGPA